MKKARIVDTYKQRFKKISKHYTNLLEDFDPEEIHLFRVEMKKLRAFIRLNNLILTLNRQKIPKEIKSFYNITGNIRNLQLHHKRVLNLCEDLLLNKPSQYLEQLADEEKQMRLKAKELATRISFNDFEKKLRKQAAEKISKTVYKIFVAKNNVRLAELIALPFFYDEALHEIRKILKDISYNWSHIEQVATVDLPAQWTDLSTIEKITEELGNFHDLCVALYLLTPQFVDETITQNEKEILNVLKDQLQLRKTQLKDGIADSVLLVKKEAQMEKTSIELSEIF